MSTEDDEEILPKGTLFGRYRIEHKLGAGAMGAVYAATHVGLNKPVVVKVLLPHHARSREVRQRFLKEGEAAARIRHPHVVDVTDVGMHEQMPFLVMERLDGESLGSLMKRTGAFSPDIAIELLLPIIDAVGAAHAAGVVHRDLKPENLFVTSTPTGEHHPKVLDFGISRVVTEDGDRQTGTAAILGTPAYMAPEQIVSSRDVDARSDQYSLGVILYECLTGCPAFSGNNIYAILRVVGEGRFLPPRAVRAELPVALEAIVLRSMALDPAARFDTLRDFTTALLPFASERAQMIWGGKVRLSAPVIDADTLPDARKTPPPGKPDTLVEATGVRDTAAERGLRRGRFTWVAAAVGVLATGVVLVAVSQRSSQSPRPSTHTIAALRSASAVPTTLVVSPPAEEASPVIVPPSAAVVARAPDDIAPAVPVPTAPDAPTARHAALRHHPRGRRGPSQHASSSIDIAP